MNYQGDIALGDTVDIKFTTVNTTGVPTTLAGTPVISAYVDNSTTEITVGVTLTVDFDGRVGLHNVRVVASSGNGFAAATNVSLVITTGTVSGNSVVGYVIGSFSIAKRPATLTAAYDAAKTAAQPGSAMTLTSAYDAAKTAATQASVNVIDDFVDTEVAAIKVVTDKLDTALELDGAVYRYTANALETAPSGGPTAAAIADAVWDEPAGDHVGAGSTGQKLNAASAAGDPWSTGDTGIVWCRDCG